MIPGCAGTIYGAHRNDPEVSINDPMVRVNDSDVRGKNPTHCKIAPTVGEWRPEGRDPRSEQSEANAAF
jgi:hypothetical protein